MPLTQGAVDSDHARTYQLIHGHHLLAQQLFRAAQSDLFHTHFSLNIDLFGRYRFSFTSNLPHTAHPLRWHFGLVEPLDVGGELELESSHCHFDRRDVSGHTQPTQAVHHETSAIYLAMVTAIDGVSKVPKLCIVVVLSGMV